MTLNRGTELWFISHQKVCILSLKVIHVHLVCLWKNVHNFSLEGPAIFLSVPFSYNYPSHSFLCMSNFNPLLHY